MFYRNILTVAFLFTMNQMAFADHSIADLCEAQNKCRIIIDAGSSGSRAHLYKYEKNKQGDLTNFEELLLNKVKPGLSELSLEEIPDYLSNLMKNVPERDFTIDLYATAGMRLLPEYKQYAIYAKVRDWFANHENFHLHDAKTISGAEEGLFGWLAMNYALGDKTQDLPGFIEIGGASTQVVFPVQDFTNINSEDIITFEYKKRRVSLFSHSFLGFGANEIMKRFNNLTACFPIDYQLNNNSLGQGNGALCQQEIMDDLNANNYISYFVKLSLESNPVNTWYTVGAISTISQKSPLNITGNEFTINELFTKVDMTYCNQPWSFQTQNYANSDDYLNQNCLITSFFYGTTINGFGLDKNQTFKTFAKGQESDWTIGVLQINNLR